MILYHTNLHLTTLSSQKSCIAAPLSTVLFRLSGKNLSSGLQTPKPTSSQDLSRSTDKGNGYPAPPSTTPTKLQHQNPTSYYLRISTSNPISSARLILYPPPSCAPVTKTLHPHLPTHISLPTKKSTHTTAPSPAPPRVVSPLKGSSKQNQKTPRPTHLPRNPIQSNKPIPGHKNKNTNHPPEPKR